MQFQDVITVKAPPKAVFQLYADVSKWHLWDSEVKKASLDGIFEPGSCGVLFPANGPKAKICLSSVVKDKSFSVFSKLPLCRLTFDHELLKSGDETQVLHSVSFTGPLSFFFGRIIGKQIRKGLPTTLRGLKNAVEAV